MAEDSDLKDVTNIDIEKVKEDLVIKKDSSLKLETLRMKVRTDYTKETLKPMIQDLIKSYGYNPALICEKLKTEHFIRLKKGLKICKLYPELFNPLRNEVERLKKKYEVIKNQNVRKDATLKIVMKKTKTMIYHAEKKYQTSLESKKI